MPQHHLDPDPDTTAAAAGTGAEPARPALLPLGALMLAGVAGLGMGNAARAADAAPAAAAASAASATGTAAAKQLPKVTVQDRADKPDGLRATTTRVGKTLQDPHDIPQAVTTVTNTLLQEQQVGSLKEAMRNISGVSFNAAEGGRAGDNFNLRGFYTFGDMYLDGIRDTAQYNRETFNTEQLDVLRGAGAMLFGRGQAGGVINQVTKTPLRADQHTVTATVGSYDYRELTADLNRVLSDSMALRVNLMNRDEGSWRSNPSNGDEPEIHRRGIGLSLTLAATDRDQLWLNHQWLETDDKPDYGISFDASTRAITENFPSDTYWGTNATFDESNTTISTLVHEHRFSPTTLLRSQLRVADYMRSYWARTPSASQAPNPQALVLGNNGNANGGPTRMADYDTITLQSDFSTRFNLAGMQHEVLTGLEYLREDSWRHSLLNQGGTTAASPPYYYPYVANTSGTPVAFHSASFAGYLQDTVEFLPQWKATLGARRDFMDAQYSSTTSPKLKFGENSYRGALSWQPGEKTHVYLSWSSSFSPTADLYQLTVTPQPPERSRVVELGTKWLLADGDLALRAAVYQATKEWERSTDLESTAAILTKKRRTNGLELEAAGRVTEAWEVFGGIALMNARILEVAENVNATTGAITVANTEYEGKRARNTPEYTFNLWTTYALPGGWTVGGGAQGMGDRHAVNPSGAGAVPTLNGEYHPNTVPGYVRWDAMVSYAYNPSWKFRLNIKNLADKVYYESVYDNGGFAVAGTRRTATLTAEYSF